jgi:membrane-associated phospholipid phosphatase
MNLPFEVDMEKLLRSVYESEKKKKCLSIIGKTCVWLNVAFFALVLAILALGEDFKDALIAGGIAVLGYLFVTLMRGLLNRPRPYEVYDFYTVKPKEKSGHSFPSRHCYSALVISTLSWLVSPLVFAALLIAATLIALTRVLLGIHFVRDVVCGAAIGALFGVIGVITATFI